jgi:hypothetical protein
MIKTELRRCPKNASEEYRYSVSRAAVPLYVKTGESVEFWQATNLDAGLGLARKLPCRDNLKWLS